MYQDQLREMEESVMPFGFIENGIDELETTKFGNERWVVDKKFTLLSGY